MVFWGRDAPPIINCRACRLLHNHYYYHRRHHRPQFPLPSVLSNMLWYLVAFNTSHSQRTSGSWVCRPGHRPTIRKDKLSNNPHFTETQRLWYSSSVRHVLGKNCMKWLVWYVKPGGYAIIPIAVAVTVSASAHPKTVVGEIILATFDSWWLLM